jgi:ABC-type amino acid transport substrate-binding protein
MRAALLFILLMGLSFPGIPSKTVFNVVTYTAPPLIGGINSGEEGLAIDLLRAVFDDSPFIPVITLLPRARVNHVFFNHSGDVYLGAIESIDEAQAEPFINTPLVTIRNVIFYDSKRYPSGITWQSPNDLRHYNVGILKGGSSEKMMKKYGLPYDPANKMELLFKKLAVGRNDLVIISDLAGKNMVDSLYGIEKNTIKISHYKSFSTASVGMAILNSNPKSQAVSIAMHLGLSRIYRNGTWHRILKRYYGNSPIPAESMMLIQTYLSTHLKH